MKFFVGALVVAGIVAVINGGGDRGKKTHLETYFFKKTFHRPVKICETNLDVGFECETSPQQELYYFDNVMHICINFMYLGCGGNENKFDSPFKCESFCISGDPATNTTGRSKPSDSGTIDDGEEV